jgi:hypothetical protein
MKNNMVSSSQADREFKKIILYINQIPLKLTGQVTYSILKLLIYVKWLN